MGIRRIEHEEGDNHGKYSHGVVFTQRDSGRMQFEPDHGEDA